MSEYHKIQTVYKRDPATNYRTLLCGEYALPEFEFLSQNEWEFTEKVDGTNIRVIFDGEGVVFGGKTDNAMLPAPLVARLQERFGGQLARLSEAFPSGAILYGEGYGAKIQKGGGNYRPDQDFVLFDIRVGEWWLERDAIEDVARKFGLDPVPVIGRGTLTQMVLAAERGFDSAWGAFTAEGIVARPAVELLARSGKRIVTKIKHKDFSSA